jgi:hypothetical protein
MNYKPSKNRNCAGRVAQVAKSTCGLGFKSQYHQKKMLHTGGSTQVAWLTPVILATQEAEVRRFKASSGK